MLEMKSNLQNDMLRVLKLLEEMAAELKSDTEKSMAHSFEAMMTGCGTLEDATETMCTTIDIEARCTLQKYMTNAVRAVTEQYFPDFPKEE